MPAVRPRRLQGYEVQHGSLQRVQSSISNVISQKWTGYTVSSQFKCFILVLLLQIPAAEIREQFRVLVVAITSTSRKKWRISPHTTISARQQRFSPCRKRHDSLPLACDAGSVVLDTRHTYIHEGLRIRRCSFLCTPYGGLR